MPTPQITPGVPPGVTLSDIQGVPDGVTLTPLNSAPQAKPGVLETMKNNFNANTQGAAPGDNPVVGALKNFGAGGGDVIRSLGHTIAHPIDAASSAIDERQAESAKPVSQQLKDMVTSGRVLGPGGEQVVSATKGMIHAPARTMGQLGTGLLAGAATDGALGEVGDMIPTRGKASRMFADIQNSAKDVPVSMTRTQPALDQFANSVKTGGKGAPVMTKLANRITPPTPKLGMLGQMQSDLSGAASTPTIPRPVNFPEARDFYTNISRATAKPGLLRRAIESPGAPAFRMNAGNVREALNSDLTDAANTIGRGADYTKAMTDYRRASQINHAVKTAAKIGVGAAAGSTPIIRFIRESGQ
jgi:hypothetical protein